MLCKNRLHQWVKFVVTLLKNVEMFKFNLGHFSLHAVDEMPLLLRNSFVCVCACYKSCKNQHEDTRAL